MIVYENNSNLRNFLNIALIFMKNNNKSIINN